MKSSIQTAAEAVLGLTALALLILLAYPRRDTPLPRPPAGDTDMALPSAAGVSSVTQAVPPETILALFEGARVTKPAGSAAPIVKAEPAHPPTDAPWLRYLGRSGFPDGTSWYFVKDTRSGRVIKAAFGAVSPGWSIVEDDTNRVVLKSGDDLYSVSKR
jgi:hypothetical protein